MASINQLFLFLLELPLESLSANAHAHTLAVSNYGTLRAEESYWYISIIFFLTRGLLHAIIIPLILSLKTCISIFFLVSIFSLFLIFLQLHTSRFMYAF